MPVRPTPDEVDGEGLELQLYLLSPSAFGIEQWVVGDSSTYRYRDLRTDELAGQRGRHALLESSVEFTVVGRSRAEHAVVAREAALAGNDWLRVSGLDTYRDQPFDRYALVNPRDLRPSPAAPLYSLQKGYFPTYDRLYDLSECPQPALELLGTETLETGAGSFTCARLRLGLRGLAVEIWVSPEVRPLGLVRWRSAREELLLLTTTRGPAAVEIDPVIEPLVSGDSTFAHGCVSCHRNPQDAHQVVVPAR